MTIFNEECIAVLASLRQVALAVSQASTSPASSAGLKDDDRVFTLSRSLPDVASAVRDVGQRLLTLVDKFEASVEDQLVTFYRTMRQQVDQEHQLLRTTKSLMPSDPGLLKHLVAATQEQLQLATAGIAISPRGGGKPQPLLSSPTFLPALPFAKSTCTRRATSPASDSLLTLPTAGTTHPQASAHHAPHTSHPTSSVHNNPSSKDSTTVASEALRSWLYITLQSMMQLCEASRGAVYLQATEGTAYLRRVCGINVEDRLPLDVSPAAGSTIATVVQNNVAVNIGRSRFQNPHALDAYSTASQAVRASVAIRINTGIILPIGDIGCVLIADKTTESYFSELDEHVAWSAATLIRGVLRRYRSEQLCGKMSSTCIQALNACALLPPISADHTPYGADPAQSSARRAGETAFLSPEEELQFLLPGINRVPRLPKKLVVIRAMEYNGFQQILAKDIDILKKMELSDEDLLEAAVPYIANLEALWKKSIDSMTELRSDCERLDREVAARNSRIVELEVELRILSRQFNAMKSDVQKIRAAVPSHLRDVTGAEGYANSPSLIAAVAHSDVRQLRGLHRNPSLKAPQPPPKKQGATPNTAR